MRGRISAARESGRELYHRAAMTSPYVTYDATANATSVGPNLSLASAGVDAQGSFTPVWSGVSGFSTPPQATILWQRVGNIVQCSITGFCGLTGGVPATATLTLPVPKTAAFPAFPGADLVAGGAITLGAPAPGQIINIRPVTGSTTQMQITSGVVNMTAVALAALYGTFAYPVA